MPVSISDPTTAALVLLVSLAAILVFFFSAGAIFWLVVRWLRAIVYPLIGLFLVALVAFAMLAVVGKVERGLGHKMSIDLVIASSRIIFDLAVETFSTAGTRAADFYQGALDTLGLA